MVGWVAPLGAVADGWWLVIIQGGRYWPVMERSSTVCPMLLSDSDWRLCTTAQTQSLRISFLYVTRYMYLHAIPIAGPRID